MKKAFFTCLTALVLFSCSGDDDFDTLIPNESKAFKAQNEGSASQYYSLQSARDFNMLDVSEGKIDPVPGSGGGTNQTTITGEGYTRKYTPNGKARQTYGSSDISSDATVV